MLRTFNCGVGMIVILGEEDQAAAFETMLLNGERPVIIGKVTSGEPGVSYTGRL